LGGFRAGFLFSKPHGLATFSGLASRSSQSAAQLAIYKLGEGRVREAAMTWVPKFAHFLTPQTVAVVQSDHTIWLCDVGDRSPSISRNDARGIFVRGSGAIHVVGETSRRVTTLSCVDFDRRVEQLKRSGDVKGALEL
jgi:hypothetical protein